MKTFMACALLLGGVLALSGCAGTMVDTTLPQGPVTMTRAEIVEALVPRTVVGMRLHLELSHEAQHEAIEALQGMLRDSAEEFLPETLTADSAATVAAILPEYVIVNETDEKFNRLYVEKVFRDVKIGFILAERIQPVAPKQRWAIERNIEMLTGGLYDTLLTRLDWIVEPNEARAYLQDLQRGTTAVIANPVIASFKDPATDEQVGDLIAAVDRKITENVQVFKERLERAQATEDVEKRPVHLHVVRRSVLVDLCNEPYKELERLTTQKDLAGVEPGDLDPAYPYLIKKLTARAEELSENRLRDTSEGR
jgi:hypothetical protein